MATSVVCCTRNRNGMLRRSLPTWLNQTLPFDEIVIVQWGGNENPQDVIPDDDRIIFVEVKGAKRWILSHAYNLGMAISTGDILYKMDTDYILAPNFSTEYQIPIASSSFFWAGNWEMYPADQMNKRNINGCVVLHRAAFEQVNGYNERVIEYGYDDEDLYHRLVKRGWERRNIQYGLIEHIAHSNLIRSCGDEAKRNRFIIENRQSCDKNPWTIRDRRIGWKMYKKTPNHFVCSRQGA